MRRNWVIWGVLGCVLVWFAGCQGDTVVRQFECSGDSECESSKSCIEGKCVIDDKDKDGFSSKRDCNDNNKRIFPGASEVCDNGIDDNCDGNIDEKPCICLEGEQRPCGVQEVGICKRGVQFCERGQWGECKGGTLPSEELCENGKDDNCNGTVDEQPCVCKDGSKRACGNEEKGSCRKGTETCKDGKWGACEGEVKPVAEDCNGKDDDCDGSIDEDLSGSCYTGPDGTRDRGECKGGVRKCEQGQWSACVGEVKPIAEVCDSKDNDCDGLVDNGLEQDCYDGPKGTQSVGICKAGKRACVAGQWGECKGEVRPAKEDCNGKDDDCDGMVDQGLGGPCYLGPTGTEGVGECKAGVRNCDAGTWTPCVGQVLPANSDICGDKKDNNCNGSVDEGCQTNFEIRNTIDTDSGKIDGIVSVGWQGNGQFQLPSLTIPANAQVKVIGSKPLILKVQGPVEIIGTLALNGGEGKPSDCTNNFVQQGGVGAGAGGTGGTGSNCNTGGGQPPGGDGTGASFGKGGTGGGVRAGSGGGGGHATVGGDGTPAAASGKGGAIVGSATTLTAGSGGGGGSCGVAGSSFFQVFTPGGSGGGGGGAVQIESTVGDVTISGAILAQGGEGGAGATCNGLLGDSSSGGSGGGGSGGMIWILAKGQITVAASAYLDASGGKGKGTAPSGKGGDGGDGRIRLQDQDGVVAYPSARVNPIPTLATY